MSDAVDEVSEWFDSRGFRLEVAQADGACWASRGETAEGAALRARERFEQEQWRRRQDAVLGERS